MGQMHFISSFFVRFFFQNYLGSIIYWSHVTDVYADQTPLYVHSTLILKQWRHSDQHVYSCAVWSCCLYQKAFRDKQCNFWPGFNVHVQPGKYFLQSPLFCETTYILKFTFQDVKPTQETAGSGLNMLYNVLCCLWNIHSGAPLPHIYSITNTKHWIAYTYNIFWTS